jgi:SNF2 family DNA or RNA helicase
MQQVVGGFAKLDEQDKPQQLGRSKLDALSEIIDQVMESGEKLVIFARFLPEVAAICQEVEKKGIGYGVIFGEIKQEDRGNIVENFQNNPDTKIFVAQIQTAGLGITLHAASVAVFYSLDFSYANYSQATARIHRIGQKKPCLYLHLIAQGTIDEQILKALKEKQDLSKTICDDWRKYFLKGESQ